jgi:hypothetical protein
MSMFDKSQAHELKGLELRTTHGEKIGKIGAVYVDDDNDLPEWVTVDTGLFGTQESFVPLVQAERVEDGVVVPYTKKQIKDAPGTSEDEHLGEQDERALYEHYNIPYLTEGSTFADTGRPGASPGGGASSGTTVTGGRHVATAGRRDDGWEDTSRP